MKMPHPMPAKYWRGDAIDACVICDEHIQHQFVFGATIAGPWTVMCVQCFYVVGRGLGDGLGHAYTRQPDGRWLLS